MTPLLSTLRICHSKTSTCALLIVATHVVVTANVLIVLLFMIKIVLIFLLIITFWTSNYVTHTHSFIDISSPLHPGLRKYPTTLEHDSVYFQPRRKIKNGERVCVVCVCVCVWCCICACLLYRGEGRERLCIGIGVLIALTPILRARAAVEVALSSVATMCCNILWCLVLSQVQQLGVEQSEDVSECVDATWAHISLCGCLVALSSLQLTSFTSSHIHWPLQLTLTMTFTGCLFFPHSPNYQPRYDGLRAHGIP